MGGGVRGDGGYGGINGDGQRPDLGVVNIQYSVYR